MGQELYRKQCRHAHITFCVALNRPFGVQLNTTSGELELEFVFDQKMTQALTRYRCQVDYSLGKYASELLIDEPIVTVSVLAIRTGLKLSYL